MYVYAAANTTIRDRSRFRVNYRTSMYTKPIDI